MRSFRMADYHPLVQFNFSREKFLILLSTLCTIALLQRYRLSLPNHRLCQHTSSLNEKPPQSSHAHHLHPAHSRVTPDRRAALKTSHCFASHCRHVHATLGTFSCFTLLHKPKNKKTSSVCTWLPLTKNEVTEVSYCISSGTVASRTRKSWRHDISPWEKD